MRRVEKRRPYKGQKRRDAGENQLFLIAILTLLAVLAMTIHANSYWTGKTPAQQLYQALFVTKDWE